MKKNIHPDTQKINVVCNSCNHKFDLSSTSKKVNIDVCSNCHPFYTGQSFATRSIGRVDRFRKKYNK